VGSAAAELDKNVLLLVLQDQQDRDRALRYLRPEHVDGVLLMSLHGDDPLPGQLEQAGVPTVLIGRPLGRSVLPYVDADNRGGSVALARHLVGLGRRTVATIAGLQHVRRIDRLDGYRDALEGAGLRVRKGLVGRATSSRRAATAR
jgi:DNA-binding LacI/PurR family transcriptional regulator